ncbi:MAG TPA: hypothetical protein VFK47_15325 [Ktedonobacteraceae bacterium]|nr:hypothetical protein [Ktedonobacteraceae bacterium]
MPTGQQYATNVPQTTLTGLINPTATLMSVNSSSGWPATPFTAVLDIGTSLQEPIDVTNITGTTWTIVRAIDGTVGFTHPVNSTVTHADIGRDFREARSHIDSAGPLDASSEAVHGLTNTAGNVVVGTKESQTLTNKTLTSPTLNGSSTFNGTIGGSANMAIQTVGVSGTGGSAAQASRDMGTTTSGPPTSSTYNAGDHVWDQAGNLWFCTVGGTPGTWVPAQGHAEIFNSILGSPAANFSFNVPSWVNHLELKYTARSNAAATGGTFINLQFNSDTANHYSWQQKANATGVDSNSNSGASLVAFIRVGVAPKGSDLTNSYGTGTVFVGNIKSNQFKPVTSNFHGVFNNTPNMWNGSAGGEWQQTAAITSVQLIIADPNFDTNSSLSVIGYV